MPPMSDAPTVDQPAVPISVGLLSRHSIVGGLVVGFIALFYILGVPLLNGVVEGDNPFKAGEPYVVRDSFQITPQPGWEIVTENELLTTIGSSGAQLVLIPAVAADQTLEEAIQPSIDGLEADTTNTWVISEPTTFVTDAGDHGIKVVGHSPTQATETWVISNGEMTVTLLATSPDSVWNAISPKMDAIAASVVILAQGSGE